MARSLWEARREAAERLDRSVDNATHDVELDDLPAWAKVADAQALRGVPAVSQHSAGSAIAGTQPGTDAHLDALSRD
jgi:hypothetical protein